MSASSPEPESAALVCPVHPDRAAVAACLACGRWLCAECRLTDAQGMPICAACAAERAVESVPGPAWAGVDGADTKKAPAAEPDAPGDDAPSRDAPREDARRDDGPRDDGPREDAPSDDEAGGAVAAPGPIMHPDAVEVTGESPIAWEHPDRFGDFVAYGRTVFEAFTGPIRFMGRIPWVRRDYRTPLVFALVSMVLGHLGVLMALAADPAPVEAALGGLPLPDVPLGVLGLISLPIAPLWFTAVLFVQAGLAHLLIRLAGADERPFEATFRVFAYATVADLLQLVPGPGPLLQNFMVVFLVLTGMRIAHQTRFLAGLLALVGLVLPKLMLPAILLRLMMG